MERAAITECYDCAHMRRIPGDSHVKCAKPDPEMQGNPHGIREGWFFYPLNFDPTWKAKLCNNWEAKDGTAAGN